MAEAAPTMIIPAGTQIQVDQHGQLSVTTPGNLVLQNSGNYGTLESTNGSIRIEPDVQVEAVNVRCARICYVQGSLTAWKVEAEAIQLEESARAHIILQETRSLQIGKEARLVGNFSSEKELFLLFSRFAQQMRSLPFGRRDSGGVEDVELGNEALRQLMTSAAEPEPASAPVIESEPVKPEAKQALSDELFYAQVLLEREVHKTGSGPNTQRVVREVLDLLRSGEVSKLERTHTSLFADVVRPSSDLRRAMGMINLYFGTAVNSD